MIIVDLRLSSPSSRSYICCRQSCAKSSISDGVPFSDKNGFSFFRDAKAITLGMRKDPLGMPWTEIQEELFEVSELPPITGLIFLGSVLCLSINTADFLEDIFINQNKYHTKSEAGRANFSIMT